MDMNDKEKDTLPMLERLIEMVNSMQQQMNSMQQQMNSMQQQIDNKFEDARLRFMSVEVQMERLEALEHKALSLAYDARADIKVLREEVYSWSKDIMALKS